MMMKSKCIIILKAPRYLYSGIVLTVILYLTLAPHPFGDNNLSLFPNSDKIAHFVLFGFFSSALVFDEWRRNFIINYRQVCIIGFISCFSGGIIELLQEFMGLGRTGDLIDFIADAAGAFSMAFLSSYICRKWLKELI